MKLIRIMSFFVICFAAFSGMVHAIDDQIEPIGFLPAESTHANWVFSGNVTTENDEHYAYFFQMKRHDEVFHATVALFDAETKTRLLFDEETASIEHPEPYNWQVGHVFLRFNAINASWVFGFKTPDKKGFNFKVDMLNQSGQPLATQDLREGVEFLVSQTGQLNGHVQVNDEQVNPSEKKQALKEEFVTAKNAWFRQIWLVKQDDKSHELSSVLCRFNDGSGFYAMNMLELDAMRASVAGAFDAHGDPSAISQFINVKQDTDGPWHIRVTSPNVHLILSNLIEENAVVAGFVSEENKQGFCMLSQDEMGEQKVG
jgi:hypothetical protein